MSSPAVRGTPKAEPGRRFGLVSDQVMFLVLALGFVLACRLLLYARMPDRASDFDQLYDSAARLLRGENPYSVGTRRFPYPLPAVLLAVPFTMLPLSLARPVFDVLAGWAFVYALWRFRGRYALLAAVSGAYLFAMAQGQTTPLMVAASLIPAFGFLLAVKPNIGGALWISRPTWTALLGAAVFLVLSLLVVPSWPMDWWMAWPLDSSRWAPPVLRPFGFILLLAALRWRSPEGRLILAMAIMPQSTLPHDLVPLALIPATLLEMGIYAVGSWIAVAATTGLLHLSLGIEWSSWPATLGAVYLPMLALVLRPLIRGGGSRMTARRGAKTKTRSWNEKERRRPYRLADDELKVDATANPGGGFTVTVTHLPPKRSATESGENREAVERKAHDKLAGFLAVARRAARTGSEADRRS
jgi:hypothetical protein